MSKFLEIPGIATTPMCLHQEALCYILRKFQPGLNCLQYPEDKLKGQEEKLIQSLIDKSNYKLRMYGSAGELLENINIYKDFPANHKFFGTCDVHYQTRPRIFTSFNNEKYIAKSDLFVILQNMILPMGGGLPVEVSFILDYYLKSQEEKVRNSTEFLRFDEKRFNQLEKEIKEEMLQRQLSV
ncbi:hypothetical protein B9Z55_004344 [Caenorhabditis nigoni]|uniref:DUF7809 domain-containing protein n=1 Tax=Caenorhabditis nigoni TaxID=1611254 RepID=A0A2G5UVZ9_9PELO|nr:hypothetical protein B9Z55_004344 [Caenorhabditis nigoni]